MHTLQIHMRWLLFISVIYPQYLLYVYQCSDYFDFIWLFMYRWNRKCLFYGFVEWNLREVLYREATCIVLVHFWYFYLSTKSLLHETGLWRDGLFLKHAKPTLIYDQKVRMYMSTSVFAILSNVRTQNSIIVKLGQTQMIDLTRT